MIGNVVVCYICDIDFMIGFPAIFPASAEERKTNFLHQGSSAKIEDNSKPVTFIGGRTSRAHSHGNLIF